MSNTTDTLVLPSESADGWAHLTLDRNAWYVRFYLWLYKADANNINTCKLFWAYVFAPIVLPLAFVLTPVGKLLRTIDAKIPDGRPIDWEKLDRKRARQKTREEKLENVSSKMSVIFAKAAPALRWVGILLGLAIAGLLILLAVSYPKEALGVLLTLAAILVGAGLLIGLIIFFEKREQRGAGTPGFIRVFGTLAKSFHRHTCAKVDVR